MKFSSTVFLFVSILSMHVKASDSSDTYDYSKYCEPVRGMYFGTVKEKQLWWNMSGYIEVRDTNTDKLVYMRVHSKDIVLREKLERLKVGDRIAYSYVIHRILRFAYIREIGLNWVSAYPERKSK